MLGPRGASLPIGVAVVRGRGEAGHGLFERLVQG